MSWRRSPLTHQPRASAKTWGWLEARALPPYSTTSLQYSAIADPRIAAISHTAQYLTVPPYRSYVARCPTSLPTLSEIQCIHFVLRLPSPSSRAQYSTSLYNVDPPAATSLSTGSPLSRLHLAAAAQSTPNIHPSLAYRCPVNRAPLCPICDAPRPNSISTPVSSPPSLYLWCPCAPLSHLCFASLPPIPRLPPLFYPARLQYTEYSALD